MKDRLIFARLSLAVLALSLLSACTTAVESRPPRTATEELLISTAADRAAAKLDFKLRKGTPVFVDSSYFEGTDSKYAISAIRDSLLKQGARLVDSKAKAQTVVEIRNGALSIDKSQFLVGVPSFNIPIPLTGTTLPFPEIAFYKSADQEGLAKFAFTAYSADSGTLEESQKPEFGFAHNIKRTAAVFFSWSDKDFSPDRDGNVVTNKLNAALPPGK
ncbi:MAG: hypothetical protein KGI97_03840 [Alphaproteobacteria bacterium]|nr:hypothetical protein [Alphaproteobacteria bacterium]